MFENPLNKSKISLNKESTAYGADRFASPEQDLIVVSPSLRQSESPGNILNFEMKGPTDFERTSMVKFIAGQVATQPDWRIAYYERMMYYRIKPQEILDQLGHVDQLGHGGRPEVVNGRAVIVPLWSAKPSRVVTSSLAAAPAETVIYCWPYHFETPDGKFTLNSKAAHADPIVTVVTIFGAIWVIATLMMIGVKNISGFWYCFKLIPFMILPLLGLVKGLTHIRVSQKGLVLQSASGKSTLRSNSIAWHQIIKVSVKPAKAGQNALSGKLIIDTTIGKRKVSLKKIASSTQWRKLVSSLSLQIPERCLELDPALLDGINQDTTRDPSYTKLWLDALTSPPMRERLQPLVPGLELQKGRYKIESLLGSGGQGSAYLAATDDGKVVLKEYILPVYVDVKVRRKALEDFEKESRLLASMHHPGIVKTTNSFIEDHRAYLSLEYVPGKSLKQLVDEGGPLSEADCAGLAVEMCEILSYLHAQQPAIVHQDFTPDNLLVLPDCSLKLIDFMVAKQCDSDSAGGAAVGKHHYMPPEQFRGKATTRSDIYALGCTLHYLLTGCKPEPMSTSHPTLQNARVSGAMNSIVEKATMLDQGLRYQSAREMMQDLNLFLKTED